jgi:hypothetical protein
MKVLRVIDALQLPEVLAGSKWFALPVPVSVLGPDRRETTDHNLPTMTVGIDPTRRKMYYCDCIYDARAMAPTHFGTEAALTLKMLLGECKLVDVRKGPEW